MRRLLCLAFAAASAALAGEATADVVDSGATAFVGDFPPAPAGWAIERAPVLDGDGLAGTVRFVSPSGRVLVYVRHVARERVATTPRRWLSRYNRDRHFDEHGTRAYTLGPEAVAEVSDGRLVTQTVMVETDRHWPFTIETYAWFRPAAAVRWAAIVDTHDGAADSTPATEREAARALVVSNEVSSFRE